MSYYEQEGVVPRLVVSIEKLQARIRKLEEALRFYADPLCEAYDFEGTTWVTEDQNGNRAREALGENE